MLRRFGARGDDRRAGRRGLEIAVGEPLRAADGLSLDWNVRCETPAGSAETRYALLRWDDIVRARFQRRFEHRVGIARALSTNPKILLCDEATSALDPQTTASVLQLLAEINRELKLTIVLITHEMNVIKSICDRVAVMENGQVVEEGDVLSVFTHPQQPITRQFVRQVGQYADEEAFNPQLASELGGTVIKLTFTGHSTHQPIVGELTLRYGLPFNILHGKMTQTAHGVFGQLWLHVVASEEQLNNILDDLQKSGIDGEVIQHG